MSTMTRRGSLRLAVGLLVVVGWLGCAGPAPVTDVSERPIVGVKIYETDRDFSALFEDWADLGVHTVFAPRSLVSSDEFRDVARRTGTGVFVIFPVFFAPDELAADPELWAVTADGERAKEDWVEFACPSRGDFRKGRVEEARKIVRELHPTGLSIDFIRHFVFWEMVGPERDPDTLPDACYCSHCLEAFAETIGAESDLSALAAPDAAAWIADNTAREWVRFKCNIITTMVEEIAAAVREVDRDILINIHAVPWRAGDYDGAVTRIAGQDRAALGAVADFLSPMCYSFMLHRPPEWVASVVDDFARHAECRVLPSIQVATAYREGEVFEAAAFEATLRAALTSPSAGVVFWSWDHIEADPERAEIIRRVVREDLNR
jgi:hypothetical protein